MYECFAYMYVCALYAHGCQRKVLASLKLWAIAWVLGVELRSSLRATSVLNPWTTSLASQIYVFKGIWLYWNSTQVVNNVVLLGQWVVSWSTEILIEAVLHDSGLMSHLSLCLFGRLWKKRTSPPTSASPGRAWWWSPCWMLASTCSPSCPSSSSWCLSRTRRCCLSSPPWLPSPPWAAWLWSSSISFRSVSEATQKGVKVQGFQGMAALWAWWGSGQSPYPGPRWFLEILLSHKLWIRHDYQYQHPRIQHQGHIQKSNH